MRREGARRNSQTPIPGKEAAAFFCTERRERRTQCAKTRRKEEGKKRPVSGGDPRMHSVYASESVRACACVWEHVCTCVKCLCICQVMEDLHPTTTSPP